MMTATEIAEFENTTGWKFEDAAHEANEVRRETRIFGSRSNGYRPRPRLRETETERFERETGWTYGDAVEMAADLQRERRIFGRVA